jgi:hypothetical protein
MSAYVVSNDTINFIVSKASAIDASYYWGGKHNPVRGNERTVAGILYTANVESVNERYSEDDVSVGFKFKAYTKPQSITALLSCLACLDYQSCEIYGYDKTIGATIIRAISKAAIRELPGYNEAPWGL